MFIKKNYYDKYIKYKKKYIFLNNKIGLGKKKLSNYKIDETIYDKIYIIPNISEIKKGPRMDKENYSGRLEEKYDSYDLDKKINVKTKDKCSITNYKKYEKSCTYNQSLDYDFFLLNYDKNKYIFENIIKGIKKFKINNDIKHPNKKLNFFIVTHHHVLREKIIKQVKKKGQKLKKLQIVHV